MKNWREKGTFQYDKRQKWALEVKKKKSSSYLNSLQVSDITERAYQGVFNLRKPNENCKKVIGQKSHGEQ